MKWDPGVKNIERESFIHKYFTSTAPYKIRSYKTTCKSNNETKLKEDLTSVERNKILSSNYGKGWKFFKLVVTRTFGGLRYTNYKSTVQDMDEK